MRFERIRIDHSRDRVGRIVEAIDELKAQRDQQRQTQQHIGPDA